MDAVNNETRNIRSRWGRVPWDVTEVDVLENLDSLKDAVQPKEVVSGFVAHRVTFTGVRCCLYAPIIQLSSTKSNPILNYFKVFFWLKWLGIWG